MFVLLFGLKYAVFFHRYEQRCQTIDIPRQRLMSEIGSFPAHRLIALKPKAKNIAGIGGRLKAARSNLRLKQEAVASHLGIGTRTYVEREAGRRAMSVGEIEAMGELGVNIHWLVTGEGEMMRDGIGISPPVTTKFAPVHPSSLPIDEVARIFRKTKAFYEEAAELSGWRPPRRTEDTLVTFLFTFALSGAFAETGDLVELLASLRGDIERREN